jgi:hypothetical protein
VGFGLLKPLSWGTRGEYFLPLSSLEEKKSPFSQANENNNKLYKYLTYLFVNSYKYK